MRIKIKKSHKISDSGPSIPPFQLDQNQLPEEASFVSKLDSKSWPIEEFNIKLTRLGFDNIFRYLTNLVGLFPSPFLFHFLHKLILLMKY